jgi:hypothetical protein
VKLSLPPGGHRAVRIDFVSAYTTIDVEAIRLCSSDGSVLFEADTPEAFDRLQIAGDATRIRHPKNLRIEVTGIDPQLYLPQLMSSSNDEPVSVYLKLRVTPATRAED